MVEISLTRGKTTLVDDCDAHLSKWKWHLDPHGSGYAFRSMDKLDGKRRSVYLHHAIMGFPLHGKQIDHIDGHGLNNLRFNLRIVTKRQNLSNTKVHRGEKQKSSKFLGVYWHKKAGKWLAQIVFDKKHKYLGIFDKEEYAAQAYLEALK